MAVVQAVNYLLASGKYVPLLELVKGFRNGVVYGAKVRAPHSLVMTFLWRDDSLLEKFKTIALATFTHSKGLALFTVIYKVANRLLEYLKSDKEQFNHFISAFISGYIVFGRYNKVNEQINLYLLSRIIYGLSKLAVKRGYVPEPKGPVFPWFAAMVWGIVLWLFEHERDVLQPSLRSSMTYLYDDSKKWHTIRDFLIYNK